MGQVHHIALLGICTLLGVAYCMNCPEESGNCQSFVCWYKEWAKTMNQWRLQIESRCTQEELGEEWKELFTCPIMECKNGSTDDCETDPLKCPTENAGIFLDVIFVVDGSSSIDATEFSIIKQWLINQTLQIYNEYGSYAQVEVLQFSNKDQARHRVPIGESKKFIIPFALGGCVNDDLCVTERITNMQQLSSQTYINYALRRTMEWEFLQSSRYNESLKIIVLLTDGEANDETRLPSWYNQYQDVVTTFAVGVGNHRRFMALLRTVANGNTGNERVFTLDNFEQLAEGIDLMIEIKSLVRGEGTGVVP